MPKVSLFDRTIKTLQPLDGKQTDYWDSSLPAFGIRVSPTRKTWVVMYRYNGLLRRLSLGAYPVVSLADARELGRAALHRVAAGYDPAAEKMAARRAQTFAELATDYLEKHAKPNKKSWKADEWLINKELLPRWRTSHAAEISRADVRDLLDTIADRGARIQANRVLALVRKIFNFAIQREIVKVNPCQQVPRPGVERQRDRVLSEDEIRSVWAALKQESDPIQAIFQLRLLTAQRGGEVLSMEWDDVELTTGWWTIPGEKAKNGLAHRVPLNSQAITILQALLDAKQRAKTKRKKKTNYVFPSPTTDLPIAYVQKAIGRIREASGVDFQGHDLRRTAASLIASAGTPRLVVSKILNHVEREVTAIYDRHGYDAEKRAALDAWGRKVESIINETPSSNVVTFRIARRRAEA